MRAGRPVFSASWWIGICPTARGKVIGTRPPGFTAPATTRAIASGPRVPRCQVRSTAGARSIQSSTTSGRPVASSTMNGTPVSAIAWMRRSWSPGRRMSARELASPEIELGSPTATITRSFSRGQPRRPRGCRRPTAPGSPRPGATVHVASGRCGAQRVVERARLGAEVLHPGAEMIGAGGVRAGQQDRAARPAPSGSIRVVVLQQHDAALGRLLGDPQRLRRSARIARSRHPCRGSRTGPAPVLSRSTRITASSIARGIHCCSGSISGTPSTASSDPPITMSSPADSDCRTASGLVARDTVGDQLRDAVGITDDDAAEAALAGRARRSAGGGARASACRSSELKAAMTDAAPAATPARKGSRYVSRSRRCETSIVL